MPMRVAMGGLVSGDYFASGAENLRQGGAL